MTADVSLRRPMYYGKSGSPLPGDDISLWADLSDDPAYKYVLDTYIRSRSTAGFEVRVATLWLGFDFDPGLYLEPPYIFETKAFANLLRGESVAYRNAVDARLWQSLEDAWRGHWEVVGAFERRTPDYETCQSWWWKEGGKRSVSPFS